MGTINFMPLFGGETLGQAVTLAAMSFVLGAALSALLLRAMCCKGAKESEGAGAARRDQPMRTQRRNDFQPHAEKRHPAPADGSFEIYVGNLSYDVTDEILRKEFEAFGKVNYARVITNRYNNRSKGFGFVHMPNRAEVDAAIAGLSDKEILGRKIKCNEAKNVA